MDKKSQEVCVCVWGGGGGGGVLIMVMATDACWGGHFVSNHAFCCRTGFLWRTSVIIVCHASGCTEMGLGLNQFYRSVIFAVCRITEALITRIWRWYLTSFATAKWWRHQMEKFSALLTICAGNSPVTGEFPTQRPVTNFDVFFDLRQNKRLSKQSWGW